MSDVAAPPSGFATPYVGGTKLPWLRPLIAVGRWALLLPTSLAAFTATDIPRPSLVVATVLLAGFALWRTFDLVVPNVSYRIVVPLEIVVTLVAVVVTDRLASPYVPMLIFPVFSAGLGAGWAAGGSALAAAVVVPAVSQVVVQGDVDGLVQALLTLVPAAAVGAIGRSFVLRVEEQYEVSLGKVSNLEGINALLASLTEQVRSLPVARKTSEVIGQVREQVMAEFKPDGLALLVHEREVWRAAYAEGIEIPGPIPHRSLPQPLLDAGPFAGAAVSRFLRPGQGLSPQMEAGVYQWLWARGQPIGLLALEYRDGRDLDRINPDVLERLAIPLALALDNAQWFERLHMLGVEEERQRIGGQLHDRFAQSLAFVGIELDRVIRKHPDDDDLKRVREHVTEVLGELRETMRDLRVTVGEDRPLVRVLATELERFGDRYGIMTELMLPDADIKRLPLPVEQQFLRIVQELLGLAQREGGASAIDVWLAVDDAGFLLAIDDDGHGVPDDELGTEATERLAVVRARADAIGAEVVRRASKGKGAQVRVFLRDVPRDAPESRLVESTDPA